MLAIKYREDFAQWPIRVLRDVTELPQGYDELFSEENFTTLLNNNRAAFQAFLIKEEQEKALKEGAAKFAAVRAKWQNMADLYATQNSASGINTATAASIADSFSNVEKYLRLNVPTKAISEIDLILPIEPYLPQSKINSMKAELLAFIQATFNL